MNEIVPNQQNLIIYNTLDGKVSVAMMARDGNVWMNQKHAGVYVWKVNTNNDCKYQAAASTSLA